jgi:hypothetical protein
MSIIRKEQLTNPLSASYALTASYATNASSTPVNTGSLLITASVSSNIITFTKGDGSTFPITVNTGSGTIIDTSSLVTTSSFNAFTASINIFTASYNTGSFTGSFSGSFYGTASWTYSASQALTASYYIETDPIFVAKSASLATTGSNIFIGNQIITGSLNISGSIVMNSPTASITGVDYIDFDTNHTIGTNAPSWKEGRLFYDSGSGALAFYNWEQDVTLNIGQEQWLRARNQTGTLIANGTVVRLVGAVGDRPTVEPAQATDQTNTLSVSNEIIGMATHDIENGTDGFVTTFGLVNGVNTSAFNAGDILWVSQSAGQITNIAPAPPFDRTFVGIVTRKNTNNGSIFVTPLTPIHFHDISSVSASIYQQGDLWVYRSGSVGQANAWINTKTLGGNYTISGSLVLTGSLKTNDGVNVQTITASFVSASGGITGSLYGTSSWATNARTSSYILSSNVYGPGGFDSVNAASSAGTAATATELISPAEQNLIINGEFVTLLSNSNLDILAQTLHAYTGHIIEGTIDGGVSAGDLIYLDYNDNTWYQVDQTTDSSTKILGAYVDSNYVLLVGDIVLDASYITSPALGKSIFISGSARFTSRPENLTSGYIRSIGHIYYNYNDGIATDYWILRFKPSNDWMQIQ